MMIGLLSAPSNLGLRPPAPTSVPGCAKAPEALREAGLHQRVAGLGAEERVSLAQSSLVTTPTLPEHL